MLDAEPGESGESNEEFLLCLQEVARLDTERQEASFPLGSIETLLKPPGVGDVEGNRPFARRDRAAAGEAGGGGACETGGLDLVGALSAGYPFVPYERGAELVDEALSRLAVCQLKMRTEAEGLPSISWVRTRML